MPSEGPCRPPLRWRDCLRRALSVAAFGAIALAAGAGLRAPWSSWGWWELSSAACLVGGALVRTARVRRPLLALGGASVALLLIVRIVSSSKGPVRLVTLPPATSSRWLAYLLEEEDVSLLGTRGVLWRWRLPADERAALLPAMHDAYTEMHAEEGAPPSPLLDTFLARQGPSAFDTIVIEPGTRRSGVGLIFLHGYGGSFALECWLVAGPARAVGAVTVCPAVGVAGHWGDRAGDRTVRATLDFLRGRGVTRIYLAGLSNGASGAAALAPRLASRLAGLILLSGAPATSAGAGLPTLVVHGEHDTSASPRAAHAYASRTGTTYAGFDGGHFILLTRRAEVRATIAGWLLRQESPTRGH